MVNRYVTKSEHDLFIDCLPYEWRSGTSGGLFLPIYPPRSMHVMLCFLWLVDFCNKYVSSLWLMLSPWIIRTLTLPPLLASLVPRNFHRYHAPIIYLPKIAIIPTYYGIFIAIPRYIAMQLSTVSLLWHASSLSYCLDDHVVDVVFVAKPLFIILSYMSHMHHCTSRYTAGGIHIESYFVLSIEL